MIKKYGVSIGEFIDKLNEKKISTQRSKAINHQTNPGFNRYREVTGSTGSEASLPLSHSEE